MDGENESKFGIFWLCAMFFCDVCCMLCVCECDENFLVQTGMKCVWGHANSQLSVHKEVLWRQRRQGGQPSVHDSQWQPPSWRSFLKKLTTINAIRQWISQHGLEWTHAPKGSITFENQRCNSKPHNIKVQKNWQHAFINSLFVFGFNRQPHNKEVTTSTEMALVEPHKNWWQQNLILFRFAKNTQTHTKHTQASKLGVCKWSVLLLCWHFALVNQSPFVSTHKSVVSFCELKFVESFSIFNNKKRNNQIQKQKHNNSNSTQPIIDETHSSYWHNS